MINGKKIPLGYDDIIAIFKMRGFTDENQWIRAVADSFPKQNCAQSVADSAVLKIDRFRPLNPVEFMVGAGWEIEEQDERSLALSEVNPADIRLVTILRDGESRVIGEERLLRLKAESHVRLDAKIFQAFRDNKDFIPENWKGEAVYFDGTVFRNSSGDRCVLYLCWGEDDWYWHYRWFKNDWHVRDLSAVLAE